MDIAKVNTMRKFLMLSKGTKSTTLRPRQAENPNLASLLERIKKTKWKQKRKLANLNVNSMRNFFKWLGIKKREKMNNNNSNVSGKMMPDPTDIKKVIWEYYD